MSNQQKYRVFVTQPIPPMALRQLEEQGYEVIVNQEVPLSRQTLLNGVKDIDALYCTLNEKIDKEVLDHAGSRLKVIGTCSVGYDHVDVKECAARNIPVGHTSGVRTATAEFAVALLLNATRRLSEGLEAAKNGEWTTWQIMWLCGRSLKNAVGGIFGLGRIGLAIAQRLKGFEVSKIIYNDIQRNPEGDQLGYEYVSFDDLLKTADFVICACAATKETYKIFNKENFDKMHPNTIFVNIARGTVVDQDALYDALSNHKIVAAALDVTDPEPLPQDHKLWTLPNCYITPHMCSAETASRIKMSTMTSENIIKGLNKEPLTVQVKL